MTSKVKCVPDRNSFGINIFTEYIPYQGKSKTVCNYLHVRNKLINLYGWNCTYAVHQPEYPVELQFCIFCGPIQVDLDPLGN